MIISLILIKCLVYAIHVARRIVIAAGFPKDPLLTLNPDPLPRDLLAGLPRKADTFKNTSHPFPPTLNKPNYFLMEKLTFFCFSNVPNRRIGGTACSLEGLLRPWVAADRL
jgi:hypothetical protein